MKTTVIVDGNIGIGRAIVTSLLEHYDVVRISRTPPQTTHKNVQHFRWGILKTDFSNG